MGVIHAEHAGSRKVEIQVVPRARAGPERLPRMDSETIL